MRRLDLSIGRRLSLGFGAAAVLLVLIIAAAFASQRYIAGLRQRQLSFIAPRVAASDALENAILYLAIETRTYVVAPKAEHRAAFEAAAKNVNEMLGRLSRLPVTPEGRAIFEPVPDLARKYIALARVFAEKSGKSTAETQRLEDELTAAREEVLAPVRGYAALQRRRLIESQNQVSKAVDLAANAALGLGAIVLLLLAGTAWLTVQAVRGPALALVDATRRVAVGDFSALDLPDATGTSEPFRDELAELTFSFARMAYDLRARDEEIQLQQEELQSQNEELQIQGEELQSQNEELQAQGEELQAQSVELHRTVELLTAGEEMLRQADKHKTEFLAVLSHELRNPLTPIKNSLYILGQVDPLSEQARRAHTVIERQVSLLSRLVSDLLDITRISNGKVQLQRSVIDLSALLREVAEDSRAEFGSHDVDFVLRLPEGAVYVQGDPQRIMQVVGNMLHNAAKFTPPKGRVTLTLETPSGEARIHVEDSGMGLDEATLGRLFEPFVQADDSLARTHGGLGLGLALVKGLVELHGGTVRASSDGPGKGARFSVILPMTDGPVTREKRTLEISGAPRRILVIDDNVDIVESLREALELGGHQVETAFRGRDGIERAREWRPEVVLCDIGLPDIDGHEVARVLRDDPSLAGVFLVALSGYALAEDKRRAAEAGFDAHLAKPARIGSIEAILASLGARS